MPIMEPVADSARGRCYTRYTDSGPPHPFFETGMTGPTTLHCPNCMADVTKKMSVNAPESFVERFYCRSCGHMSLKEELVRETKLSIYRSGATPPPPPQATIVSSELNAIDLDEVETNPAFRPGVGNSLVVCIGNSFSEVPIAVSFGGVDMTEAILNSSSGLCTGSMWYMTNPPDVTSKVTVAFSGITNDIIVVVYKISGRDEFVNVANNSSVTPNEFDSFSLSDTLPGDVAIGMCALSENVVTHNARMTDGFSTDLVTSDPIFGSAIGMVSGQRLVSSAGEEVSSKGTHGPGPWVSIVGLMR